MAETGTQLRPIRFGNFEVDLRAGELRRAGVKLKFGGQPLQVLIILLERPGEVVTREELQKQLWPDTFVDVDHNLNTAINKIREVLGDSAESPRFVETLPRRGYRFIAPVVEGGVVSPDQPTDQPAEKLPPMPPRANRRPLYYGLAIFGTVIITVAVLALWKRVSRTPGAPGVANFRQLADVSQARPNSVFTDGSRIYFTQLFPDGHTRILQLPVKGGEATPLPVSLKRPEVLDVSRDGTELLIGNSEGKEGYSFWIQPIAGGSPRRIGSVLGNDQSAFNLDGTGIIFGKEHDIYSVNRDGSSFRKLLATEGFPFAFRFSPDARVLRFSLFDISNFTVKIMEVSPEGVGLHKLLDGCCGDWTPDGRLFIFQKRWLDSRDDLWALPEKKGFRWRNRDDKPTQLTAGPLDFRSPVPGKNGKEIFAIGASPRVEVVRYDTRSGEFVPYLNGLSAEGLAFSPDGQWVAYTTYPDGLLWRSRLDGSDRLQLTFPPLGTSSPHWSHDAKQIVFNAEPPGEAQNVYTVSSQGGTPQRILPSQQGQTDANWSPDGNSVIFGGAPGPPGNAFQKMSIYTLDLKSRRVSTLPDSNGLYSPRWSPDGRYIAAITADPSYRLMLFDFATQKWTEAFGSIMGYEIWSQDGKYIYFESFNQDVGDRIVRLRLSDRKIEKVVDLKDLGLGQGGTFGHWFGLAPDDSPLVARDLSTQEIYALEMKWP